MAEQPLAGRLGAHELAAGRARSDLTRSLIAWETAARQLAHNPETAVRNPAWRHGH